MPKLVLIRHARAADGPVDRERPLTDGGRRDASALGRRLRELGVTPDRVAVSPALRAVQTWNRAATAANIAPSSAVLEEHVYENTPEALLAVVHDTPADVQTLAIVGHNPSVHSLAAALGGDVAVGFPAGAMALFEMADFAALQFGDATPLDFWVPSDAP